MPPWKYTGLLTRILLPEAMFRADTGEMSIFLTYDDGPDPEVTPALLDILAERDAKAVFFVIFNKANWWKDLIREISQQGHRIALHGMRHRSKYMQSNSSLSSELINLAEQIRAVGSVPSAAYRPPFGHIRPDTVPYLKRRGIQTVLWTNIPGDYSRMNDDKLYNRAVRNLLSGDIIVLHDGTRLRPAPTLELTRRLLDYCQQQDLKCRSLDLPEFPQGKNG